uniref:Uncharacterized protein n=1 Tax=Setaria italica TaxID=4555 RepID=K3ZGT3_SETIT
MVYVIKHCRKSFHVPCAIQIIDCRYDVVSSFVFGPMVYIF